jgi:hypothetical protein
LFDASFVSHHGVDFRAQWYLEYYTGAEDQAHQRRPLEN